MKIYFFPHKYLRDRHLDTIRRCDFGEIINPEIAFDIRGAQVSEKDAVSGTIRRSWRQRLPLVNVKIRPKAAPDEAVIYVWGALITTGKFIVDLDNPYSLVGYNPSAMPIWRYAIAMVLQSSRCLQIRCLSEACRSAVGKLFGEKVLNKAVVVYPRLDQEIKKVNQTAPEGPRFLFVGTQFSIKGGPELLMAFRKVRAKIPSARLDLVTHLPLEYQLLAEQDGVEIHKANLTRAEVWSKFMRNSDVLVHPSYMESFGMVLLEALSHGMAIIANDVYAHREMVFEGVNGLLLEPPVYYWEGGLAGPLFFHQSEASSFIKSINKDEYVAQLARSMVAIAEDPARLLSFRQKSCTRFTQMMSYSQTSLHEC